ncbi:D-tyrosyl-tRNA deacylase [Lindgomyces ingoldianus]|uniref:D-tyrosyl-tRNA deacylase n=1 Tax=Lindgomyces ingoldianus TaxID=673940 RepID=A0ACB6R880_9PLEO|nr:D-tyrosyl-tRNA deacylase [Lindgomyces ingoldianus]KAF2475519.1 D-tyrosyl-tRNA deacylase [Lindgomyces ingoldianus]
MRTVLQRVKSASVTVDGELVSKIGKGLLVLAAISKDDTEKDVESMAGKILKAKLWDDEETDPPGRWKKGVADTGGELLCVSQFTLLASMKKGNKPDFHQSASGLKAKTLYQAFFKKVQDLYEPDKVKDGIFAAMMDVALVNDGPVGIDYTCLDGEVQPRSSLAVILPPPPNLFD